MCYSYYSGFGLSAFTLRDITNDNLPEMMLGNLSGGLSYFTSDSVLISNTSNINHNQIIIFPNPTKDNITISSEKMGLVIIRDLFGGLVYSEIKTSSEITINTFFLAQGIYIIQLGNLTSKISFTLIFLFYSNKFTEIKFWLM